MEKKQNIKLIGHALVKIGDKYLLIRRTKVKRGKSNSLPEYWDIPGGMVEEGEMPKDAVIRETKEEVNLDITISHILHEDSNYDKEKGTVFTRIVYQAELLDGQDESNIILQEDEHSEYMLVNDISNIDKIVEYLYDTIEHANIYDLGSKIIKKAKKDKI